jgi:hypothetical protein
VRNIVKASLLAVAGAALSTAAVAQTTAPSGAAPASPPAAAAGATNFSDADLQKFASAAIELNKIQSDASVPAADKQPKMLAAVQASGMDPAKFNAIAEAAQSDPSLQQKIQAAAAKTTPTAPAAQPAPAAPPQQ